jgi:hypothetical protein
MGVVAVSADMSGHDGQVFRGMQKGMFHARTGGLTGGACVIQLYLSYHEHLTVRLSEVEKTRLARRAKAAGKTSGDLVREFIREEPFVTAADLLGEMEALMGDKRLRVKPRK